MSSSILTVLGSDGKAIFKWLTSRTGQKVITAVEDGVGAVDPPIAGLIQMADNWLMEIFKTQLISSQAGSATGAHDEKATMTINGIRALAVNYAKAHGYPIPTDDALRKANDALVAFSNALEAKA